MRVMVVVALVALAGCAEIREARTARDIDRCEGYGFTPGSPEFAQCRMKVDSDRRRALGGNSACTVSGATLMCY